MDEVKIIAAILCMIFSLIAMVLLALLVKTFLGTAAGLATLLAGCCAVVYECARYIRGRE